MSNTEDEEYKLKMMRRHELVKRILDLIINESRATALTLEIFDAAAVSCKLDLYKFHSALKSAQIDWDCGPKGKNE